MALSEILASEYVSGFSLQDVDYLRVFMSFYCFLDGFFSRQHQPVAVLLICTVEGLYFVNE